MTEPRPNRVPLDVFSLGDHYRAANVAAEAATASRKAEKAAASEAAFQVRYAKSRTEHNARLEHKARIDALSLEANESCDVHRGTAWACHCANNAAAQSALSDEMNRRSRLSDAEASAEAAAAKANALESAVDAEASASANARVRATVKAAAAVARLEAELEAILGDDTDAIESELEAARRTIAYALDQRRADASKESITEEVRMMQKVDETHSIELTVYVVEGEPLVWCETCSEQNPGKRFSYSWLVLPSHIAQHRNGI